MDFKWTKKIKIHPLFCVLMIGSYYKDMIIEINIVFISLTLHELAHVFMARREGYEIEKFEILPIGERAIIKEQNFILPKEELFISFAGPLISLIFAGIFKVIFIFFKHQYILFFYIVNLTIGLFNLLPIFPLDGGRIFRSILLQSMDMKKSNKWSINISRIFSLLLFILGFIQFIKTEFNFSLLAISIYIFIETMKEEKKLQFNIMNQLIYKNRMIHKQGYLNTKNIIALNKTPVSCVLKLFQFSRYHIIEVVNEDLEILGKVEEKDLYDLILTKGFYARIEEFL